MGDGEEQLQKEWRDHVMSEMRSLKQIASETRDIVLQADLQKIADHESRIRTLEQAQRQISDVKVLKDEVNELHKAVDGLKGWKNKSTGILIGMQLVILVLWALLLRFGSKMGQLFTP